MIEFMVLGLPRSGTTWASNWLTTDTTLCLHDPLWNYHYTELDAIESQRMIGISCTGLFVFPDWLNKHPARKIILHRNLDEINESLTKIGLEKITSEMHSTLEKINGLHLPWTDIFNNPKPIYEFLLEKHFDEERHALLKKIEMQPNFAGLTIGKDVTKLLMRELGDLIGE